MHKMLDLDLALIQPLTVLLVLHTIPWLLNGKHSLTRPVNGPMILPFNVNGKLKLNGSFRCLLKSSMLTLKVRLLTS